MYQILENFDIFELFFDKRVLKKSFPKSRCPDSWIVGQLGQLKNLAELGSKNKFKNNQISGNVFITFLLQTFSF
jgi:hypothetical protein